MIVVSNRPPLFRGVSIGLTILLVPKKKLCQHVFRARREHAVHRKNLYEKPMIEILLTESVYKGERCGESETVLCRRKNHEKKVGGLPQL